MATTKGWAMTLALPVDEGFDDYKRRAAACRGHAAAGPQVVRRIQELLAADRRQPTWAGGPGEPGLHRHCTESAAATDLFGLVHHSDRGSQPGLCAVIPSMLRSRRASHSHQHPRKARAARVLFTAMSVVGWVSPRVLSDRLLVLVLRGAPPDAVKESAAGRVSSDDAGSGSAIPEAFRGSRPRSAVATPPQHRWLPSGRR